MALAVIRTATGSVSPLLRRPPARARWARLLTVADLRATEAVDACRRPLRTARSGSGSAVTWPVTAGRSTVGPSTNPTLSRHRPAASARANGFACASRTSRRCSTRCTCTATPSRCNATTVPAPAKTPPSSDHGDDHCGLRSGQPGPVGPALPQHLPRRGRDDDRPVLRALNDARRGGSHAEYAPSNAPSSGTVGSGVAVASRDRCRSRRTARRDVPGCGPGADRAVGRHERGP